MSTDPHAAVDLSVLDIIEHSPVGGVPHTPTYQDALRRLYAAHQVYASADHKDGHATARSVALQPAFQAANLAAVGSGQVPATEIEANARVFDRYVASLPAARRPVAETHRLKAVGRPILHRKVATEAAGGSQVHDPLHSLFLVPGSGPRLGLPGNYLFGSVLEMPHAGASATWRVQLHDAEDSVSTQDTTTLAAAVETVRELIATAPFHLSELEVLGFKTG